MVNIVTVIKGSFQTIHGDIPQPSLGIISIGNGLYGFLPAKKAVACSTPQRVASIREDTGNKSLHLFRLQFIVLVVYKFPCPGAVRNRNRHAEVVVRISDRRRLRSRGIVTDDREKFPGERSISPYCCEGTGIDTPLQPVHGVILIVGGSSISIGLAKKQTGGRVITPSSRIAIRTFRGIWNNGLFPSPESGQGNHVVRVIIGIKGWLDTCTVFSNFTSPAVIGEADRISQGIRHKRGFSCGWIIGCRGNTTHGVRYLDGAPGDILLQDGSIAADIRINQC